MFQLLEEGIFVWRKLGNQGLLGGERMPRDLTGAMLVARSTCGPAKGMPALRQAIRLSSSRREKGVSLSFRQSIATILENQLERSPVE